MPGWTVLVPIIPFFMDTFCVITLYLTTSSNGAPTGRLRLIRALGLRTRTAEIPLRLLAERGEHLRAADAPVLARFVDVEPQESEQPVGPDAREHVRRRVLLNGRGVSPGLGDEDRRIPAQVAHVDDGRAEHLAEAVAGRVVVAVDPDPVHVGGPRPPVLRVRDLRALDHVHR